MDKSFLCSVFFLRETKVACAWSIHRLLYIYKSFLQKHKVQRQVNVKVIPRNKAWQRCTKCTWTRNEIERAATCGQELQLRLSAKWVKRRKRRLKLPSQVQRNQKGLRDRMLAGPLVWQGYFGWLLLWLHADAWSVRVRLVIYLGRKYKLSITSSACF